MLVGQAALWKEGMCLRARLGLVVCDRDRRMAVDVGARGGVGRLCVCVCVCVCV